MVACFVEFAPHHLAESAESKVRSPVTKASYCWRSAVFVIEVFALEQSLGLGHHPSATAVLGL